MAEATANRYCPYTPLAGVGGKPKFYLHIPVLGGRGHCWRGEPRCYRFEFLQAIYLCGRQTHTLSTHSYSRWVAEATAADLSFYALVTCADGVPLHCLVFFVLDGESTVAVGTVIKSKLFFYKILSMCSCKSLCFTGKPSAVVITITNKTLGTKYKLYILITFYIVGIHTISALSS